MMATMLQTPKGRRLLFVLMMTISAPIFGGLQSYRKLRWQDDFWSDMLQVELIIAVGTLIAAFIFWTALTYRQENKRRGGVAGLLTALFIIPLPVFGWAFKNQLIARFADADASVLIDIIHGVFSALVIAAPIFTTKAILALPLSFIVGYFIAQDMTKNRPA